jgi:sedoheptulose-bisphosphatase
VSSCARAITTPIVPGSQADVQADDIIFKHLKGCGAVHTASSEERPEMVALGGEGYSVGSRAVPLPLASRSLHVQSRQVAFDPLDGSSVVTANFAVGSIFGVWPSDQILGKKGEDQAAALYSIYGPRTIVVLAYPHPGEQWRDATTAAAVLFDRRRRSPVPTVDH